MKADFQLKTLIVVTTLLRSLPFYAQHEVKIEKRYGELDYAPQIAGIYDGEISFNKFCSATGITTKIGARIITFDLYYCKAQDTPVHIIGNEIPDTICAEIQNSCLYTDVFINNVKAMDIDGSVKNLSPIRFYIIKEDD
jgi:hypothetical protein